jgi:hypothetical protein
MASESDALRLVTLGLDGAPMRVYAHMLADSNLQMDGMYHETLVMLQGKKAVEQYEPQLARCDVTHHLAHCDIFRTVTEREVEADGLSEQRARYARLLEKANPFGVADISFLIGSANMHLITKYQYRGSTLEKKGVLEVFSRKHGVNKVFSVLFNV